MTIARAVGLATARGFAAEGCAVALWDVPENVTAVATEIAKTYDVAAYGERVDIVDFVAVERAWAVTRGRGIAVEHVVHCAAIGSGKFGFPFTNLTPGDWSRTLEINVLGMVNVAHAVTPAFVESGRGTFVFLASVAGQIGSQTDPPYSASKAANINFAQCMAKDLARRAREHGLPWDGANDVESLGVAGVV